MPVVPFALTSRAGIDENDVQHWVSVLLAAYGAAMLVASPIAGWFADNTASRRGPLLIGLFALAGATVLLCLARTVALLVLGRILQGCSAAVVWTVGLALMVDTVGEGEVGEMFGYVSFAMTAGFTISPLIGGIVYEKTGYYPVFYICFALIAIDVALRLAMIEKKVMLQWKEEGQSADSNTVNSAVNPSGTDGQRETREFKSIVLTINTTQPVLPAITPKVDKKGVAIVKLLSSPRLLAALWGIMIEASLTTAFDSTLPLFVQRVFNWDSIGAGLIFLCLIVPSLLAPAIGWVADRYGSRWLVVLGFLGGIPLYVLLRLINYNSIRQKVLLCALLSLIGITMTIVMGPLIAEITYVVEAEEKRSPGMYGKNGAYAQAYGLFTMAFSLGTLVGPFWSGFIEVAAGWDTMTWTLGLLSAAGIPPCIIYTSGLLWNINAKTAEDRAAGVTSQKDEKVIGLV